MEEQLHAAGLKLPGMERGEAVKSGFRAVTHGIRLKTEAALARSVESGMATVNAVWVTQGDEVELWRKAAEMNVFRE